MTDIFLPPRQYIQREGVLGEAGRYLKAFGRRPLVLGDQTVLSIVRPALEDRLSAAGLSPSFALFGGECSLTEIRRLAEIIGREKLDFVVGTGGGKALDTARCTADKLKLPLITVPTSAATCSAASAAAVIYENGVRQETVNGKGADLVLVDSIILSQAPVSLLAAGMGDALAKWYEGKPTYDQAKDYKNPALQAAMNLSTQTKETIFGWGVQAKQDVEAKKNSRAVETIVETDILLTGMISGVGGSQFRMAVAHSLLYGFTHLPQVHERLHGEVVSYGIVVQLCLEENEKELDLLLPFFARLGLPLTLKKLGLDCPEDPRFWAGLKHTAGMSSVQYLPFKLDEKRLYQAIQEADRRFEAVAFQV